MVWSIFHLDQVLCFYAVLSTGNWHGTVLKFIDQTIEEEFKDKSDEVLENLKQNLFLKSIEVDMKEARKKNCARQEKGYETALKKLYIDGSFQVFLKDAHTKYYWM